MGKNKKNRNKSNKPVIDVTNMTPLSLDQLKELLKMSGQPDVTEAIGAMCEVKVTINKQTRTFITPTYITGEGLKTLKQMTGRMDAEVIGMALAETAERWARQFC